MLLPETNHSLRFVSEGIDYVTSTPKTISSVGVPQKTLNPNMLKSSRINISRSNPVIVKSLNQKSILPILSISHKVAVCPEIETIPIRQVNKGSLLKENINVLSEKEESNKLEINISNLQESDRVEIVNPHSLPEEVEEIDSYQELQTSQDNDINQGGYESDNLSESESTQNFDNYVNVESVSDGENVQEAPENQEDALSEIQLAKTAENITTSQFEALKERRIACPNGCGNFFYIKSALQKHIKYNCGRQYPSQSYRFKCCYCDSRSEYSYSIMRHISKHHKMLKPRVIDTWRNEILEKKEAPAKESDPNNPSAEDDNQLKFVKQHECPNKCGSSFDHVYNISRHIRRTCPKVQRYQCPYCKYRTRTFLLVTRHIEMNHKLNKVCAINVFTKQIVYRDIRRRSKITKKENTIVSTKIGKPLNPEAGGLSEESSEKKKKKQRFQCPNDCGLSFNYKHTLDNHLRFVCGKLRFKCPYCSKQCRQEWGAIIHIKHRHPGRKNFVVDVLRKKVIYDSGGIKHCNDFDAIQDQKIREEFERAKSEAATAKQNQTHQQGQPQLPIFKCPHCNKLCKHAWNLSMHIKFRHPNVKNYQVPSMLGIIKCEDQQENVQDKDLPEMDHQEQDDVDVQETERFVDVEDSIDETGDFSENASEVGHFDILEDNKESLESCVSSLASAEFSLDSEVINTSAAAESTFKSPTKGKRNFLCPNNCGSLIKYEHNLTRHLQKFCGKYTDRKCPHCQYRCKQRVNMSRHITLLHSRRENPVVDNDSSKELANEAETDIQTATETTTTTENEVVVKKEPLEVDSTSSV